MMASRAILEWPKAFDVVIETMRASADGRRGFYGRAKEIGQLAVDLGRFYNASSKACRLVETAVDDFYVSKGRLQTNRTFMEIETAAHKWITWGDARQKCTEERFMRSLIKFRDIEVLRAEQFQLSPVYFNREQFEKLMEERRQLVPLTSLSVRTGMPMSTLEGLCHSNHINVAKGAVGRFRLPSVHPAEHERFEASIIGRASQDVPSGISILPTLQKVGMGHHLLRAVRACLDNELRFSLLDRPLPILSRLMVSEADLISLLSAHLEETTYLPEKMTAVDVSIHLDISHKRYQAACQTRLSESSMRQFFAPCERRECGKVCRKVRIRSWCIKTPQD
jgi:hypothetical protein